MKTSFHTYNDKNKGFWINEAYFELISHFVVLAFKEKGLEDKPEWYLSVYDDFLDISSGHVQGYAYLTLKDDLEFDSERELEIIKVLEKAINLIKNHGEEVKTKKLNEFETLNKDWGKDTIVTWIENIKTSDLTYILEILIKMLKQEWDINIDITWPITNKEF